MTPARFFSVSTATPMGGQNHPPVDASKYPHLETGHGCAAHGAVPAPPRRWAGTHRRAEPSRLEQENAQLHRELGAAHAARDLAGTARFLKLQNDAVCLQVSGEVDALRAQNGQLRAD